MLLIIIIVSILILLSTTKVIIEHRPKDVDGLPYRIEPGNPRSVGWLSSQPQNVYYATEAVYCKM